MKPVLVDASSAILLYKSGLIPHLISLYETRITESVFAEITFPGYSGSDIFKQLCLEGRIRISSIPDAPNDRPDPDLQALNSGERDTIRLHQLGGAEFIVLDDGRAARYCKRREVPFINALLVPRILFMMDIIQESDYHQKRAEIITNGRYSTYIIDLALTLPDEAMQPFLPGRT